MVTLDLTIALAIASATSGIAIFAKAKGGRSLFATASYFAWIAVAILLFSDTISRMFGETWVQFAYVVEGLALVACILGFVKLGNLNEEDHEST